eukprot:11160290-Lingulodinium_polyedra.AAC.1
MCTQFGTSGRDVAWFVVGLQRPNMEPLLRNSHSPRKSTRFLRAPLGGQQRPNVVVGVAVIVVVVVSC